MTLPRRAHGGDGGRDRPAPRSPGRRADRPVGEPEPVRAGRRRRRRPAALDGSGATRTPAAATGGAGGGDRRRRRPRRADERRVGGDRPRRRRAGRGRGRRPRVLAVPAAPRRGPRRRRALAVEPVEPARRAGRPPTTSPRCGTRRSGRWRPARGRAVTTTAWRLGSLTKLWACPGLRLGYVDRARSPTRPARVAARQPRWAVNGLALAVVEPLLADDRPARLGARRCATSASTSRRRCALGCRRRRRPTANWVLVRSDRPLRDELAPARRGRARLRELRPAPARSASPCPGRTSSTRCSPCSPRSPRDAPAPRSPSGSPPTAGSASRRRAVAPGRLVRARDGRASSDVHVARPRAAGASSTRRSGSAGRGSSGCGLRRALGDGPAAPWRRPSPSPVGCSTPRPSPSAALLAGRATSPGARLRVRSLVGRDTSGSTTPASPGPSSSRSPRTRPTRSSRRRCGRPSVGAPAVLAHRAVNTLDAMVGHRTDRYEPLRLGERPPRRRRQRRAGRRRRRRSSPSRHPGAVAGDRACRRRSTPGRHPSPNAGVIEGAFAAALGIALGGTNRYGDVVEDRGRLGAGPDPVAADIARAVRLRRCRRRRHRRRARRRSRLSARCAGGRAGGPSCGWRRAAS